MRVTSRRRFLSLAASLALSAGCTSRSSSVSRSSVSPSTERMIVLGVDGMDPTLTQKYVAEGRMPHFAKLMKQGSFQTLGTTTPPQSPVAWSSFISGTNPGGHGIFDFIARDPATMQPYHSTSRAIAGGTMRLGKLVLPTSAGSVENLRKGPTFWNDLEAAGVPCSIFRVPANFPPTAGEATSLSGMGTPDLQGGYGTFTFFTDKPGERTRDVSGGHVERVTFDGETVHCPIPGPVNEFSADRERVSVTLVVDRDPQRPVVRVMVDGVPVVLREREWSDWLVGRFPLLSPAVEATGIFRLYLKSAREPFSLYVTPVNLDPAHPSLPISTPAGYSRQLVDELGYYSTLGMTEDTHALSAGVLDAAEYRQQALFIHDERLKACERELNRFTKGFLFLYLSTLDLSSHVFWRTLDPQHPLYSPELATQHGDFIPSLYSKVDEFVGRVMTRLDDRTWLMVMSDHGFSSFRRQFNLNSWLLDNGYVKTSRPAVRAGSSAFQHVDWTRTRAYGLGINSLYLNRVGREAQGCVTEKEAAGLMQELIARLTAVKDPATGEPVIRGVFPATEIYSGPYVHDAPDLIVGYNRNYRASWETILGGFPREHVTDNTDAWSGDHCIDATLVPGVLFSNRPLKGPARMEDLAPTILSAFGVARPDGMTGKVLRTS